MTDWLYPETWEVGDHMDAETLNRRIRDQMSILLRRPLLVAHNSANQTVANSTSYWIQFDTIDQDDDGMALDNTAPAYTNFYAQRDGTYQFWMDTTFLGNGGNGNSWQTSIWVNRTTRRWDLQTTTMPTSGKIFCHSATGTVTLSHGEYLSFNTWQGTGASATLQASNNTPRIAIMWLGIT